MTFKRKISMLASFAMLVLFTIGIAAAEPPTHPVINFNGLTTAAPNTIIYTMDSAAPAPFGYEKVEYIIDTDERGRRLWLRMHDNLDEYSLEAADSIVSYIPVGTKPDCDCTQNELCLRPTQAHPPNWTCEPTCGAACGDGFGTLCTTN